MITTEYLANFIENTLNANSFGKHFLVYADEGDMREAKRCCKEYKYWTNCLLEIVSSTITPIKNMSFETATVQVMFAVDLAEAGETKVGNQDRVQSNNLIDVKNCIYEMIKNLNGQTITSEIDEKTYTVTIGFTQPTDGQKGQIGHISEGLPIYLNMSFSFFENGANGNDVHIYVNEEDLYFTRTVISKVRVAEQGEFAGTSGSNTYIMAGGKSIDMVVPAVNTDMGKAIMEDVLGSENNNALSVRIITPLGEGQFVGIFGNNAANIDVGANIGYNISIVQGREALLKYDNNWFDWGEQNEKQIRETDPSWVEGAQIVWVLNSSISAPIYWGDGTSDYVEAGESKEHTFTDGKDIHKIRMFKGRYSGGAPATLGHYLIIPGPILE